MAPPPSAITSDAAPHGGQQRTVAVTVGKIESGMAVVLTEDLHMIEVPTSLLPTARPGAIVRLRMQPAADLEEERAARLAAVQLAVLEAFGRLPDARAIAAALRIARRDHTSLTLAWPAWRQLAASAATLHRIDALCNGQRLAAAIGEGETELHLTGLEPATAYTVRLTFRTSCGAFESNAIATATPALDDFTTLAVAIAGPDDGGRIEADLRCLGVPAVFALAPGTQPALVVVIAEDEAHAAAALGVPLVTPQWVEACKAARTFQPPAKYAASRP